MPVSGIAKFLSKNKQGAHALLYAGSRRLEVILPSENTRSISCDLVAGRDGRAEAKIAQVAVNPDLLESSDEEHSHDVPGLIFCPVRLIELTGRRLRDAHERLGLLCILRRHIVAIAGVLLMWSETPRVSRRGESTVNRLSSPQCDVRLGFSRPNRPLVAVPLFASLPKSSVVACCFGFITVDNLSAQVLDCWLPSSFSPLSVFVMLLHG